MYLGIDIGGTFTDLVLMDEAGRITTTKSLTTPGELEVGLFHAIDLAAQAVGCTTDTLLPRIKSFGHGTTQATNALIERDGARTALITTRGFGDTLRLQRLMGFSAGIPVERLGWYSRRRIPEPIVPRSLVREVPERVDQAGNVLLALDEAAAEAAVRELAAQDVQTYAVCLLWSFRHPAHEQRIGEIIHDICPQAYVSLSHAVAPVLGEYERTATTAMNSYLALKVVGYLRGVEQMLRARGFRGAFNILNSSGGVVPALEAANKPVLLVASGPTGGVMGSLQLAQMVGETNVITTDMGGTSFDVALIANGQPLLSATHEAGGFHLATPMVDITTVGAGGGSIATVVDGQLRVGPASAGAKPGPVCYGRGGTRATVTDADVVLGLYAPDNFLGGRMTLDYAGAVQAIRAQIAEPLGLSVQQAAAGIRRLVDNHMADTLRAVTIGRGYDPRDFTLFAYGGAGAAHCAGFGVELGVKRIVVPATSMAHSAFGGLASDITQSAEQSNPMHGSGDEPWAGLDADRIADLFADLEQRCVEAIGRAGIPRAAVELRRTVDVRYRYQTHDLMIPMDAGTVTEASVRALVERFETTYEQVYGKGAGFREAGIALSTFRVTAVGRTAKPTLCGPTGRQMPQPAQREIFEPTLMRTVNAAIWSWLELPQGHQVQGPAVIEHPETTVYVGPNQTARLDTLGNLIIDFTGDACTQ